MRAGPPATCQHASALRTLPRRVDAARRARASHRVRRISFARSGARSQLAFAAALSIAGGPGPGRTIDTTTEHQAARERAHIECSCTRIVGWSALSLAGEGRTRAALALARGGCGVRRRACNGARLAVQVPVGGGGGDNGRLDARIHSITLTDGRTDGRGHPGRRVGEDGGGWRRWRRMVEDREAGDGSTLS